MDYSLREKLITSEIRELKKQLLGEVTVEEGIEIVSRISKLRRNLGMVQVLKAIA